MTVDVTAVRVAAAGLLTGVLGAAALCIYVVLTANARDAATRAAHDDWHAFCPCRADQGDDDDD